MFQRKFVAFDFPKVVSKKRGTSTSGRRRGRYHSFHINSEVGLLLASVERGFRQRKHVPVVW